MLLSLSEGQIILAGQGEGGNGFNWDPKTGKVTLASLVHDSNGDWVLDQVNGSEVFRVDGDKFIVTDADGTVTAFERVKNDTTLPLVGMWAIDSATTMNTIHFTFNTNSRYIMADPLVRRTIASSCIEHRASK